jgi:hypothetical protein
MERKPLFVGTIEEYRKASLGHRYITINGFVVCGNCGIFPSEEKDTPKCEY